MSGPKAVLKFRNITAPRNNGEIARLRVLAGPDHGTLYVMIGPKMKIGRGEENDIVLTDIRSSRNHAEILVQGGEIVIRDAGSTHGIAVNGNPKKQSILHTGDKIGIGGTVLEFIGPESGVTKMITNVPETTPIETASGSSGFTQFIPRPKFVPKDNSPAGKVSFLTKHKREVMILTGMMVIATLLPTAEKKMKNKMSQELVDTTRAPASLQPPPIDENSKKAADMYFKEGFREFRSKNYIRARISFETALQVFPQHPLANIYLEKTKQYMEKDGKTLMESGRRAEEANRLSEAFQKYDAIKRLFHRDQGNVLYKEAQTKIDDLNKRKKDAEKL